MKPPIDMEALRREGGSERLREAEVTWRIFTRKGIALVEQARTVFRDAVVPGAKGGMSRREAPTIDVLWKRPIATDPVTAVSLRAMTSSGHRIHHDPPCTVQEGPTQDGKGAERSTRRAPLRCRRRRCSPVQAERSRDRAARRLASERVDRTIQNRSIAREWGGAWSIGR